MIYCARVRSENYTSAGNTASFSDDITLGRCSMTLIKRCLSPSNTFQKVCRYICINFVALLAQCREIGNKSIPSPPHYRCSCFSSVFIPKYRNCVLKYAMTSTLQILAVPFHYSSHLTGRNTASVAETASSDNPAIHRLPVTGIVYMHRLITPSMFQY